VKLPLGTLLFVAACAQAAECPHVDQVDQGHLLGVWQAQVEGSDPVNITLAKHPEFAQTVRGQLEREGRRVMVAGDVVDGELTLEESQDGRRISAVWLGDVVEGSCGREIRGTWKAEGAPVQRPFTMRKQP
jgi:hypothetical protein